MNDYVLDTSALLAYIENEEGAEEVEQFKLKYIKNR
jgi:PIN domain nuclease of toxin-antitoxin system